MITYYTISIDDECRTEFEFCGRMEYNPAEAVCCKEEIANVMMSQLDGRYYLAPINEGCRPTEYCGREEYNPNEMKCCSMSRETTFGILGNKFFTIPANEKCPAVMCGDTEYTPETHQCCEGDFLMSVEKPCPRPAFCRKEIYNPSTHKCCEESQTLTLIDEPCETRCR